MPMPVDDPIDDPKPLVRHRYDPEAGRELSTAIVRAIATVEGVPPEEVSIPPLYDCIDVESLEHALFGTVDAAGGAISATFRCGTYLVTVTADGWVRIYDG
ncbi:HalOD1 output domain-containing protein [Haloplanus halophilus]|uniref:HalOD1 output domain-containing protein n=1 Tax=Haloplanus halophilus TaxID=2949993 RepID=UPI00203A4CFE|nr:HalOD1 output domain-containing protein [Haloplanus sp. GDY1]